MTVEVENITKHYGKQCVLDNVSFKLQEGEITGFLGPNGAGKTTTMQILTGYLQKWSGKVTVLGKDLRSHPLYIKKHIGYLPENNPIDEQLYIKEYLSYVAKIYLPQKQVKEAVKTIISKVGITTEQHKKIGALSKGYKQRLGLAQALIHNPKILILDEPTTGLDPNQLEDIRQLIKEESKNKIVLLSTHIMQEVEALCDRTIIINKGKLVDNNNTSRGKEKQIVKVIFTEDVNLERLPFLNYIQRIAKGSYLVESTQNEDICPLLFQFAKENNLILTHLSKEKKDMQKVFTSLTRGHLV